MEPSIPFARLQPMDQFHVMRKMKTVVFRRFQTTCRGVGALIEENKRFSFVLEKSYSARMRLEKNCLPLVRVESISGFDSSKRYYGMPAVAFSHFNLIILNIDGDFDSPSEQLFIEHVQQFRISAKYVRITGMGEEAVGCAALCQALKARHISFSFLNRNSLLTLPPSIVDSIHTYLNPHKAQETLTRLLGNFKAISVRLRSCSLQEKEHLKATLKAVLQLVHSVPKDQFSYLKLHCSAGFADFLPSAKDFLELVRDTPCRATKSAGREHLMAPIRLVLQDGCRHLLGSFEIGHSGRYFLEINVSREKQLRNPAFRFWDLVNSDQ